MLTHKGTQTLRTERLVLRRLKADDAEAMFRNWATDENTVKFLTWDAYKDIEKLREFIAKCILDYENIECYHWVIEFDGTIVGTINMHDIQTKKERCELGYCIGSKWWNKGIATEAAKAVIAFAFTELNAYKVCACHDVKNPASGRVMQKCGMKQEGLLREHSIRKDGTRADLAVYGILKSEWSRLMASNDQLIYERYKSTAEDGRASKSRASGLEFHYTKKVISEYINKDSKVIEIGCGTGYYGMYLADKCREYVGIDLTPENIELFNTKIENAGLKNVSAQVGDATNLADIAGESFDVVLCLGPMYHLPAEEREQVFDECKRVCKTGGIIMFAYISKTGAYLKGVIVAPERYPIKTANAFVLEKGTDDIHPGLFFFTMPEEIAERARAHKLTVVKNVGVDFAVSDKIINQMSDEQFEAWMELNDVFFQYESCTGLSNHALLICRKEE